MPVSAGGWGRLGRLRRGVCPPGLGLRGAVLANSPPSRRCGPQTSSSAQALHPWAIAAVLGWGNASGAVSTLIRRKREQ